MVRTNGKTITHVFGNGVPTSLVIFGITSRFTFNAGFNPLIAVTKVYPSFGPPWSDIASRSVSGMGNYFPSLATPALFSSSLAACRWLRARGDMQR
jgi:hypothetical protein